MGRILRSTWASQAEGGLPPEVRIRGRLVFRPLLESRCRAVLEAPDSREYLGFLEFQEFQEDLEVLVLQEFLVHLSGLFQDC